jgi:cell division protein FtsW
MLQQLRIQGDKAIWLIVFLLSLTSLLAVYSSTSTLAFKLQEGDTEHYFIKHTILLAIGLVVMFFVHKIDYRVFARLSILLLGMSLVLLVYTLFQGEESEINYASRWINVFGFSFQPSDLAKFSLITFLARELTRLQEVVKDFYKAFLPALVIVLVVCSLIIPHNLSTGLLLFTTSMVLMYIAGIQVKHLLKVLAVAVLGLALLIPVSPRLKTWVSRIDDYHNRLFNPSYKPAFQTQQAQIAIIQGGVFGRGAGKSVQRNYLPHPYSDFIFAIIIEEYGFLGGIFVLMLYLLLLYRTVAIASLARTFGALLAIGLAFMIVIQALVNMGVTVGILPVTGLPLPLISLGGTSIIFTCLAFGIILSVSRSVVEKVSQTAEMNLA